MRRSADGRAVIELARIGFGIGDQLLHAIDRQGRRHHQHHRSARHGRDRGEILVRVIIEMLVQRRRDRERARGGEQERVAVGLRRRRSTHSDRAAAAGTVLDVDVLREARGHVLSDQPAHGVDRSAGREGQDHLDRARRVGLRHGLEGVEADRGDRDCSQKNWFADHVRSAAVHSTLMLAVRATVDHFCVSAARKAPKACGGPGCTSAPSLAKAAVTSGAARLSLIAALSLPDDALGGAGGSNHADIGQHHVVRHAALHHGRHVGEKGIAPFARHRERPQRAVSHQRKRAADVSEKHLHLPAQHAGDGIGGALVGNVHDIDAGSQLEQFGRKVSGIAVPGRAVIELAGVRPGVGDKLRNRFRRKCGMNDEHLIILRDLGDRSEDLCRVVIAIVGYRRQHDERADVSAQQAVTIGIGARDRFSSQAAGGARAVLDHDGLSERTRQVLTENPGADIDRTARRERHDHLDRARGIDLRRRRARRENEQQNCQPQCALVEHGSGVPILPIHRTSVPIPKFGSLRGTLVCELRNRRTLATY